MLNIEVLMMFWKHIWTAMEQAHQSRIFLPVLFFDPTQPWCLFDFLLESSSDKEHFECGLAPTCPVRCLHFHPLAEWKRHWGIFHQHCGFAWWSYGEQHRLWQFSQHFHSFEVLDFEVLESDCWGCQKHFPQPCELLRLWNKFLGSEKGK